MIVCLCHRVSESDIARQVADGCATFEALQDGLLVGTSCGHCLETARDSFRAATSHAGDLACRGSGRCGNCAEVAT